MTTNILLAQKQCDTARTLCPSTDTRAVLTEETEEATLRERLLELENTSFQNFSDLESRVETLERSMPSPLTLGEKTELEAGSVFVCPSFGMLLISTWGSTSFCQVDLLSSEDESVLKSFGSSSAPGERFDVSVFLPKNSVIRLTPPEGNEYSAVFFPFAQ